MKALRALHSAFLIFLLLAPILIIWSLVVVLGFYVFSDGLETALWIDRRETALWICGIAVVASIVLTPIARVIFSQPVIGSSLFENPLANQTKPQIVDMTVTTKDPRRHTRYPVTCVATFSNEYLNGLGVIGNVSRNGCRFESKLIMTPGESGKLLIDVPGLSAPLEVATGVVRWVTGSDCGIEFVTLGPEEQKCLRWILELAKDSGLTDCATTYTIYTGR